jgi:hypothetical protein
MKLYWLRNEILQLIKFNNAIGFASLAQGVIKAKDDFSSS